MNSVVGIDPTKPSRRIHADWLTMVFAFPDDIVEDADGYFTKHLRFIDSLKMALGLDELVFDRLMHGVHFYQSAQHCSGITVAYSEEKVSQGIMVDISGRGLETWEACLQKNVLGDDVNADNLVPTMIKKIVNEYEVHFTRIDVAADYYNTGKTTAPWFISKQIEQHDMISKAATVTDVYSRPSFGGTGGLDEVNEGYTVYVGSKSSQKFLRIYNKLNERLAKYGVLNELKSHHRWEFQLRADYAQQFIQDFIQSDSLSESFVATLSGYMRFVDSSGSHQAKRSRYPDADWWKKMISDSQRKLKLIASHQKPSFVKTLEYAQGGPSNAYNTIFLISQANYIKNGFSEEDACKHANEDVLELVHGGHAKDSVVSAGILAGSDSIPEAILKKWRKAYEVNKLPVFKALLDKFDGDKVYIDD